MSKKNRLSWLLLGAMAGVASTIFGVPVMVGYGLATVLLLLFIVYW